MRYNTRARLCVFLLATVYTIILILRKIFCKLNFK